MIRAGIIRLFKRLMITAKREVSVGGKKTVSDKEELVSGHLGLLNCKISDRTVLTAVYLFNFRSLRD